MLDRYVTDLQAVERAQRSGVAAHLAGFAAELKAAGFRPRSIQNHLLATVHLGCWAESDGLWITELDETAVMRFSNHLPSCQCIGPPPTRSYTTRTQAGARRFLRYLGRAGVVSATDPALVTASEPALLTAFRDWMQHHRGVTETTLRIYGRIVTQALQVLGEDPQSYDARGLRSFVLEGSQRHGSSKAKLVMTAMRTFVRYLVAQGRCRAALVDAIPTIARWRLATLPRYLPAGDVERIVAACDPSTPVGARDRAILLLLARLGLRAGDIAALGRADLNWDQATISVCGKGRRAVHLPLPQDVGDAILHYLRHGRPPVDADPLFLRATAPWGGLAIHGTVSSIVERAIQRAGVESTSRGAHVLRHSAATELLRQGVSLDTIGALLRHRSVETTALYAKVDVTRLREIALPWPEVSPG